MAWKKQTGNTHTCGGPTFGRLAPYGTCPRCDELHRGAQPRQWAGDQRRRMERAAREAERLHPHDCKRAGCGPVCTWGDW